MLQTSGTIEGFSLPYSYSIITSVIPNRTGKDKISTPTFFFFKVHLSWEEEWERVEVFKLNYKDVKN